MVAVLFVCLGNICRSPAAEGVLKARAPKGLKIEVASCGLGDWHTGALPDLRMQEAARARGILLTSRAQPFDHSFFKKFDYILAADKKVLHELYHFAKTPEEKAKIQLITAFSPCYRDQEIPDPYYAREVGFDIALDMIEDSCEGLIQHLRSISDP